MTTMPPPNQLLRAGRRSGVRPVRLRSVETLNCYNARLLRADAEGELKLSERTLTVVNLAESSSVTGSVPPDTDCLAFDVEGLWVTYVRPGEAGASLFAARVVSAISGASYSVLEQTLESDGDFADADGTSAITAVNLPEQSVGSGGAVEADTIVLITAMADAGTPPTVRYFFSHPPYAKYLD